MIVESGIDLSKNSQKGDFSKEDTEACAARIVKHLERHIISNRNNSSRANRLAGMNKYIQLTYLSGTNPDLK